MTVRVSHSTLNYKDALAITGKGPVVRKFPMVPGIDLVGTVEHSTHPDYKSGRCGDSQWLGSRRNALGRPCSKGAPERGLAGAAAGAVHTAAGDGYWHRGLYRDALRAGAGAAWRHARRRGDSRNRRGRRCGQCRDGGSDPAWFYRRRGERQTGGSRIPQESGCGGGPGSCDDSQTPGKPLGKERWAGAVDVVGSHTLANVCATTQYRGVVTACGLAGGMDFPATVAPFILRGVTLAGIDSVMCPRPERLEAWRRLGQRSRCLEARHDQQRSRPDRSAATRFKLLKGKVRGRVVVDVDA